MMVGSLRAIFILIALASVTAQRPEQDVISNDILNGLPMRRTTATVVVQNAYQLQKAVQDGSVSVVEIAADIHLADTINITSHPGLTIMGRSHKVDGLGSVRCFIVQASFVDIHDLTIMNGYQAEDVSSIFYFNQFGLTGGLFAAYSYLNLDSVIFMHNSAETAGGLGVTELSYLYAKNCTFYNNTARGTTTQSNGGALTVAHYSEGIVHECLFMLNRAKGGGGALVAAYSASITVVASHLRLNSVGTPTNNGGGGIALAFDAFIQLERCVLEHNVANRGGGAITVTYSSRIVIRSCFIHANGAQEGGAIMLADSSTATILETVITHNEASGCGGALYVSDGASAIVNKSAISLNRALSGGGLCVSNDASLKLFEATLSRNTAFEDGGGGLHVTNGNIQLHGGVVSNNRALGPQFRLKNESNSACRTQGGCIYSSNYPLPYGPYETCTYISESAGTLNVLSFNTEKGIDTLTVDGTAYSGTAGPNCKEVRTGSILTFKSDYGVESEGFNICFEALSSGGGASVGRNGELHLEGTMFTGNNATRYGTDIHLAVGRVTVASVKFSGNIYLASGQLEGSNVSFSQALTSETVYGPSSSAALCSSPCDAGYWGDCEERTPYCASNCICRPCAAGRSLSTSGSTSSADCALCGPGQASPIAALACDPCTAGRYTSTNLADAGGGLQVQVTSGATACSLCPPGYFSASASTIVCQACSEGKFSRSGFVECDDCSSGQYSTAGAAECQLCEPGKFSSSVGTSLCEFCPATFDSPKGSQRCLIALQGYFIDPQSAVPKSVPCPRNGICPGGASLPLPDNGFWSDYSSSAFSTKILRCYRGDCVHSGVTSANATLCRRGATGPLCGGCLTGFAYEASTLSCAVCQRAITNGWLLLGLASAVVFMFIGVLNLPPKARSWRILGALRSIDQGAVRIMWSAYQIIVSIPGNTNVLFPPVFSRASAAIAVLNFEFLPLRCIIGSANYFTVVYCWSIIPSVIIVVVIVTFYIRVRVREASGELSRKDRRIMSRQHLEASFVLLYTCLPPATRSQLNAITCIKVAGGRYVADDTSISCESRFFRQFLVVDGFFLFISFSVPLLWLAALYRKKDRLELFSRDAELAVFVRSKDASLKPLRFLFAVYRPAMYFCEAPEMVKRMMFVGALPLLSPNGTNRAVYGLFAALLCALAYRETEHYLLPLNNVLAQVSMICIFLTYAAAVAMNTGIVSISRNPVVLGIILVLVNSSILGLSIALGYRRFKKDTLVQKAAVRRLKTGIEPLRDLNLVDAELGSLDQQVCSSTTCLAIIYTSRTDAETWLSSGIPITRTDGDDGICVTLNGPGSLDSCDFTYFPTREVAVAICVKKSFLSPIQGSGQRLYRIPASILLALRSCEFDETGAIVKSGAAVLQPSCIVRAFTISQLHQGQIIKRGVVDDEQLERESFTQSLRCAFDPNVPGVSVRDCNDLLHDFQAIRVYCDQQRWALVFHYTRNHSKIMGPILTQGLRVRFCRGVHFSVRSPFSYGLGTSRYEENLISDLFGPQYVNEHLGQHRADMCIAYGLEPALYQPGESGNAITICAPMCESVSFAQEDGHIYLRPDRILGVFFIDPDFPPIGCEAPQVEREAERDLSTKEFLCAQRRKTDLTEHRIQVSLRGLRSPSSVDAQQALSNAHSQRKLSRTSESSWRRPRNISLTSSDVTSFAGVNPVVRLRPQADIEIGGIGVASKSGQSYSATRA